MKDPKIIWPNDEDSGKVMNATQLTRIQIEDRVTRSISKAEHMSKAGVDFIQTVLDEPKNKRETCWNTNTTLVKWFGLVKTSNHVKDVHRRLENVYDRVAFKKITIKIRANLPKDRRAQNNGSFLSPKTFEVEPDWILEKINIRGSVVIHELMHEWFTDQKLDGEKIYTAKLAKDLAKQKPKKARKSAENYERFCLDLHDNFKDS